MVINDALGVCCDHGILYVHYALGVCCDHGIFNCVFTMHLVCVVIMAYCMFTMCNELGEVKVRITQGMNRHDQLMI